MIMYTRIYKIFCIGILFTCSILLFLFLVSLESDSIMLNIEYSITQKQWRFPIKQYCIDSRRCQMGLKASW